MEKKTMNFKNTLQTAILLFVVITSNNISAGQLLTLDDCIHLGMEYSPAIHSSQMKEKAAKAQVSEINSARLPNISFSAGYTRLSDIDPYVFQLSETQTYTVYPNIPDNYSAELNITQPLFTGFCLENASAAASQEAKAAKYDYESSINNTELQITTAYWNLVEAHEYQLIINEEVRRQEMHLTDVKNLFDQGMATRNDVLRVEVQHSNALLKQIDADNAFKLARINLENTVGVWLTV